MKTILFSLIIILFTASSYGDLGECRFKLSGKVMMELKGSVIPALKKVSTPAKEKVNFFESTQKVGVSSMMFFPPAGIAIPFAFLADILISPVKGVREIISSREYKKKTKLTEKELFKAAEDFKREWEKIEPNNIKRHILINQLYVLSFVSDIHSFEVNKAWRKFEIREDYNFIIPFIGKYLGQNPKMIKNPQWGNSEWTIKKNKETMPFYRYFHIEDFRKILKENPKLCDSPGLDALDIIGKGFSQIIKEKMSKY